MIEATALRKTFRGFAAVEGVDFQVKPGRVTGFLGPNGSGKTTTLRMLLGLVRPDSGSVTIDGSPYHRLESPLNKVGAALDGQAFAKQRTGLAHLQCWAGIAGADRSRIDHLLEMVGLTEARNKKVGAYSLGMKQRLSLATALLGDPEVLVLDEPANGLDPDGILWLRRTLVQLAEEGRTVLVASHFLAEAQRMVEDVLMIRQGELLFQGTLESLLDYSGAPPGGGNLDLEYAYLALTHDRGGYE